MKKTMFKITAAIAMLAFVLIGCNTNSGPDAKQVSNVRASSWQSESLGGFNSVYTYTPTSNTSIGDTSKKALLIVLHGCTQSNSAYKTAGLETAADQYGMIVAAPDAMYKEGFSCWGYWTATKSRTYNDYKNVINLAKHYIDNGQVDPNQVYVAGLSSGGGFTMTTACLAPDIFAGMGIMAGPSAGTGSSGAFSHEGTPSSVANSCNSYAGTTYRSHFQTQVTVTVAGTSDNTVPQSYGPQNAEAMAILYNATAGSTTNTSFGTEKLFTVNGKPVIAQLTATGLGHAWAGGSGASGSYVEAHDLNLGVYLAEFFKNYNRRVPTDTEAPVVSNLTFSNGVVSASATDNEGVVSVEFYVGSTKIGEDNTAPYSIEWDSTSVTDGNYTIKAIAYDGAFDGSNTKEATVSVEVSQVIVCHTEDASGTATEHYSAGRLDVTGYTTYGGKYGYIDAFTLYHLDAAHGGNWVDADALPTGCETGGGTTPTNVAPIVNVTAPTSNVDEGTITITASASDSDGTVAKVEFYANGSKIGEDTTAPYSISYTASPGTLAVKAVATDDDGATATDDDTTVTVNEQTTGNQAPTASVTSPTANVEAGTITITASASDSDGTVAKVEFYANGSKIGEDTTAPYSISYTAAVGSLNIEAKAIDNEGATGSGTVSITVTAPPANLAVAIISPADGSSHSKGTYVSPGSVTVTGTSTDAVKVTVKLVGASSGTVYKTQTLTSGLANWSTSLSTYVTFTGGYKIVVTAEAADGTTVTEEIAITISLL